jgi:hypothetical protein
LSTISYHEYRWRRGWRCREREAERQRQELETDERLREPQREKEAKAKAYRTRAQVLIWRGLIVGMWITGLEWYFTGKAYESFIGWLLGAEFLVGLLGHCG